MLESLPLLALSVHLPRFLRFPWLPRLLRLFRFLRLPRVLKVLEVFGLGLNLDNLGIPQKLGPGLGVFKVGVVLADEMLGR